MGSAQASISWEQWGLLPTVHTSRWRGGQSRWWLALHWITVCLFLPLSLWRLHPDLLVTSHDQPYDVLPGVMIKFQRWRRMRMAVSVPKMLACRFFRRQGPRWYNALAFLLAQRLSLLLTALFADRTIAVARSTARQLRRSGFPMRRVTAVACGVDVAALRAVTLGPQAERYGAVSVGRLAAAKGVFDLVQAWQLVVAQKPNARLAIISDEPDHPAVRQRVRRLGLAGNVNLLGAIDSDKKNRCVSACRLLTLPSQEESWSIAMGEAMALGTPVIAYDLPELQEVWGDAHHAVREGDIPALAHDLPSLLENDPGRRELTRRGSARVNSLDWSAIAAHELERLMGDLADEDPLGVDPWLVASPVPQGPSETQHRRPPTITAK